MTDTRRMACVVSRFLASSLWIACIAAPVVSAQAEKTIDPGVSGSFGSVPDQDVQEGLHDEDDLTDLSFEELMSIDVEVTSVSKKAQTVQFSAAAIHVVTQEDIKRSGAHTIPDALRLVPGVQVAQITRNRWAISARGFNGPFANKLLVLMDGRTLYSPLFAGTFWNQQDTFIDDIDRIEVIRGPGATLWGANAVNGVINIITKSAKNTKGNIVKITVGDHDPFTGAIRHGGTIEEDFHYRVWGKFFSRDNFSNPGGGQAHDDWHVFSGGVRADWDLNEKDRLSFNGAAYDGSAEQAVPVPLFVSPFGQILEDTISMSGAHFLARWDRMIDEDSDLSLQFYYDHTARDDRTYSEERDTIDLEFQHRFRVLEWNEITWGLGYRFITDETEAGASLGFDPAGRTNHVFSAFIQSEMTAVEDLLTVVIGSKFEHNDYTGFEIQPNLRVLLTPAENHVVWAAVGRSVRTPSRADTDPTLRRLGFDSGMGLAVIPTILGNGAFRSETMFSFELGYRVTPTEGLNLDLALFYNTYDGLRIFEPGATSVVLSPAPHVQLPFVAENAYDADAYGFELTADWRITDWLRFKGHYSFLEIDVDHNSLSPTAADDEISNPRHQIHGRFFVDIIENVQFNTAIWYIDRLDVGIPSYVRWDLQVSWAPCDWFELRVGVQNLLEQRHPEFMDTLDRANSEVERLFYVTMRVTF